jgi:hypothetical protein
MILEAHIQASPEEEHCERCACMCPSVSSAIEPFQDYYLLIYDDGRQETVCEGHFATLQLD